MYRRLNIQFRDPARDNLPGFYVSASLAERGGQHLVLREPVNPLGHPISVFMRGKQCVISAGI
jgi:hypothetical protein